MTLSVFLDPDQTSTEESDEEILVIDDVTRSLPFSDRYYGGQNATLQVFLRRDDTEVTLSRVIFIADKIDTNPWPLE